MSRDRKRVERELKVAQNASKRAMDARSNLPAGSTRARVTSANARWMRAAEHRDRLLAELAAIDGAALTNQEEM